MNSSQALGKRLKSAREAARLNQAECAKVAGISQPYLAQIEAGIRTPATDVLRRLAVAVDVPFVWLIDHVSAEPDGWPDGDLRRSVLIDKLAAPGLRDLAGDEATCNVLEISDEEWSVLRSIAMADPPDKDGYLLLLYAVRAVIQRAAA